MSNSRTAQISRDTQETRIQVRLDLDGTGTVQVETGIGFFDHMLDLFGRHGLFDLTVTARGDLEVDYHHTVEDTGIVLGQAFKQAVGDKAGISRYGQRLAPMDETLARVVVDFSGRPFLVFRAPDNVQPIRDFSFQLVEEFLRGFSTAAGMNLHAEVLYGRDSHHMAEALFRGLARAVREACARDPRNSRVPSTKGTLTA
jgi:imidazoleglycerol-phosphate dehydratase